MPNDANVQAALLLADRAAAGEILSRETAQASFGLSVAIGDPQAASEQLFAVLAEQGLLAAEGWLKADVRLVVVGDCFDFGSFEERPIARRDGLRNLAWLAAHPAEQVVLLLGNHDLARVGELLSLDDVTFEAACTAAAVLYRKGADLPGQERLTADFLAQYPMFPNVEVAARDLSGFSAAQRTLVAQLLRAGRFRLGWHNEQALVSHAGVTQRYLVALGLSVAAMTSPERVARALNGALDAAIAGWDGARPFEIAGLHQVGSAALGESFGILFHRPTHPATLSAASLIEARRRYLPEELPAGMTQVVGHIRDAKCRQLLGSWANGPARNGPLRSLVYAKGQGRYDFGVQAPATFEPVTRMIFVDGGMRSAQTAEYELLDLDLLKPHSNPAPRA